MKQKNDVHIHLTTKIYQDSGDERFDFDTVGQAVIRNQALYLTYLEELPNQPQTKVVFKLGGDIVKLSRTNDSTTHLNFAKNQRLQSSYPTAAGLIQLESFTTEFEQELDYPHLTGSLSLSYSLSFNQAVVGQYWVELQFKPALHIID